MTHLPNIRHHPDGSIDFDFYRRRASRQRRRTRRLVFWHFLTLLGWPRRWRGARDAVICHKDLRRPVPGPRQVAGMCNKRERKA
jgi:hypothetical protein